MSLSYAWEKFHLAVLTLTGPGSQKDRLENAYIFNIIHINKENDIPAELHHRFDDLCNKLSDPDIDVDEGRAHATIQIMNDLELLRATEEVVSIYDHLCRRIALEDDAV